MTSISFTYKPKIPGVKSGEITQTIRRPSTRQVGDELWIYTWSGKPYRSPWAWRQRVRLTQVIPFSLSAYGMTIGDSEVLSPNCIEANRIAELDGIDPPTGQALMSVFRGLYPDDWIGDYDILRWEFIDHPDNTVFDSDDGIGESNGGGVSMDKKCKQCRHKHWCKQFLGQSYDPNGSCDWIPSRFVKEE